MTPVMHRPTRHRGFAVAHALGVACIALFAGAALVPAPEPPPAEPVAPADPPNDATGQDATTQDATAPEGVREVVLTLNTGREIRGTLVSESDESVVIRINAIDTTFPRNRIAGLRELPPVAERYRQLREAVDDNDVRARLALVEWLRAREAYRLALSELEGILEKEPGNPDARTLHTWLSNHLALAARARPERRARVTPPEPDIPVLTPEQINRIRVFEIDLNAPTRMLIPDEVMRDLMVRFPESFPVSLEEREAILKLEPTDKLRMIFERKARDLYDRVRVLDDPPSMSTFKTRVHGAGGWIVNACASNRCHGGAEAGRLRLLNDRINSDETAYTNFLILDRFRLEDGTRLINHDEPARSPLLHMALPRRASLYPHPEVDRQTRGENWRFVFRSTEDRRFRETADWIASLYTPRPDYEIEYPPPPAETEPETDPAPDTP